MAGDSYNSIDRLYAPHAIWVDPMNLAEPDTMLWSSSQGARQVSSVYLQETPTEITIRVTLPQIAMNSLEIQAVPEVLCLRGEQREHVEVSGYCSFDYVEQQYQSLFMLPTLVEPETIFAIVQGETLTIRLTKAPAGKHYRDRAHQEVEFVKHEEWLVAQ